MPLGDGLRADIIKILDTAKRRVSKYNYRDQMLLNALQRFWEYPDAPIDRLMDEMLLEMRLFDRREKT